MGCPDVLVVNYKETKKKVGDEGPEQKEMAGGVDVMGKKKTGTHRLARARRRRFV